MTSLFDTSYSKSRFQGLDILRALAIILVFMSHYSFITDLNPFWIFNEFGGMGVDLFFVLSGYLIGNQIFGPVSKNECFSFKNFYIRRFLRTLPSYYFIIVIYFLIPQIHEKPLTVPFWKFITFTMNYGLHGSGFSHAWSLCVEEHFYLFSPILIIIFLKKLNVKFFFYVIISFLLISIISRITEFSHFVQNSGKNEVKNYIQYIYYPTHTRLDSLTLGILSSFLKNYYKNIWHKLTQFKYSNLYLIFGFAGLFICYKIFQIDSFRKFNVTFGNTLVAISCFSLLLSALSPHSLLYKVNIPGATKMATWSYAIYLSHKIFIYLTFKFFSAYYKSYNDSILCVSSSIVISIFGGWLLYTIVELPFLNLRDSLTKKKIPLIQNNLGEPS